MAVNTSDSVRSRLLDAGIALFRWHGYEATSLGEVCLAAGVTKGALLQNYRSKESFAAACLRQWDAEVAERERGAAFQSVADPLQRALGCLDYHIELLTAGDVVDFFLPTRMIHDAAIITPIREAVRECVENAAARLELLLAACIVKPSVDGPNPGSIARMWIAAVQGSLVLYEASRDPEIVAQVLRQSREAVRELLKAARS